jgi:hypothetical protein
MWQNHVIADLPKITTNPKLKEKTQWVVLNPSL